MTINFDMHYDPYNVWVSLEKCKFDEAMATYLIIQHQIIQEVGCVLQAKPVPCWVVGPCSGTVDSPSVHSNKCASELALALACEQQQLEEAKLLGQKGSASASLPAVPLCFFCVDIPTPSLASQPDPVSCRPEDPSPSPWMILS